MTPKNNNHPNEKAFLLAEAEILKAWEAKNPPPPQLTDEEQAISDRLFWKERAYEQWRSRRIVHRLEELKKRGFLPLDRFSTDSPEPQ